MPNNEAVPIGLPQIRVPEQGEQQALLGSFLATIRHFFGPVPSLFADIDDPRDQNRCDYPLAALLFTGVLMYLCHLGARRQIRWMLNTSAGRAKFEDLFGIDSVPHGDTLNQLAVRLEPEQVQEAVSRMTARLIRSKVLYPYRLLDRYFLVAVDGTGMLVYDERHCPHCLSQKHGDKTRYYHKVLEAKLVTENGFALSLMTEFIENSEEGLSKQDCETKAFHRLAEKLHRRFPRLPIVFVLDGLYAEGPIFSVCEKYRWKYIIVLQDKDLPYVNQEFEALSKLQTDHRLAFRPNSSPPKTQHFRWVSDIDYLDTKGKEHIVSVLECTETRQLRDKPPLQTKYKWVTNLELTRKNVTAIANDGGRLRWKIENEGFNAQKTGGYELEHAYTNHPTATKVFYFLMQIGHIIAQLLAKGSLLKRLFPRGFGSLKNLASRILEAWRLCSMTRYVRRAWHRWRFQVRFFDTS